MNLNQLSHRSYIIDHVTIVDPKKNTSFGGHVVVMEGKIDAVCRAVEEVRQIVCAQSMAADSA